MEKCILKTEREQSRKSKMTIQEKQGQEYNKKTLLFLKFVITSIIKEKKGKENYEIRKF